MLNVLYIQQYDFNTFSETASPGCNEKLMKPQYCSTYVENGNGILVYYLRHFDSFWLFYEDTYFDELMSQDDARTHIVGKTLKVSILAFSSNFLSI